MGASLHSYSHFNGFAASQQVKQCLLQPFLITLLRHLRLTNASQQFQGDHVTLILDQSHVILLCIQIVYRPAVGVCPWNYHSSSHLLWVHYCLIHHWVYCLRFVMLAINFLPRCSMNDWHFCSMFFDDHVLTVHLYRKGPSFWKGRSWRGRELRQLQVLPRSLPLHPPGSRGLLPSLRLQR